MDTRFEPLSRRRRAVLLDTDIGPDCDDVGALVVLIDAAKRYGFPIAGVCNCTSNRAGTGTIDAVCRACGLTGTPLGQWSGEGFMDDPSCRLYNEAVARRFSEAYRDGSLQAEGAVPFYRRRLSELPDDGAVVVTIGMFNDLAALLRSPPDDVSPLDGRRLVQEKVHALVGMAGILPQGRECNIVSCPDAARTVFRDWPTPLFLSDFHIGASVMTGFPVGADDDPAAEGPAAMAYRLYTARGGRPSGRNASYDLTAVQFAVEGEGARYGVGEPGRLEFYAEREGGEPDAARFVPDVAGRVRFLYKRADDAAIAASLQEILEPYRYRTPEGRRGGPGL